MRKCKDLRTRNLGGNWVEIEFRVSCISEGDGFGTENWEAIVDQTFSIRNGQDGRINAFSCLKSFAIYFHL